MDIFIKDRKLSAQSLLVYATVTEWKWSWSKFRLVEVSREETYLKDSKGYWFKKSTGEQLKYGDPELDAIRDANNIEEIQYLEDSSY